MLYNNNVGQHSDSVDSVSTLVTSTLVVGISVVLAKFTPLRQWVTCLSCCWLIGTTVVWTDPLLYVDGSYMTIHYTRLYPSWTIGTYDMENLVVELPLSDMGISCPTELFEGRSMDSRTPSIHPLSLSSRCKVIVIVSVIVSCGCGCCCCCPCPCSSSSCLLSVCLFVCLSVCFLFVVCLFVGWLVGFVGFAGFVVVHHFPHYQVHLSRRLYPIFRSSSPEAL